LLRFVIVLTALVLTGTAHAHPLTTAPIAVVDIHVTISNTRITVDRHSVPRGIEARFVIANTGTRAHNFTLARLFNRTVEPEEPTTVRLFLDYRARIRYFGGLPADRGKPGMRGVFVIR
jgi:hypothetical protein